MHERSMLTYFPHNPVRKEYLPEDSRFYWIVDPSCYKDSPAMPLMTERDFLAGTDWVNVLSDACRRRGMRVGVEIAHNIFDAVRAREHFSDLMQRDVYGNSFQGRWGQTPCHYNEDARAFAYAIAHDASKNHDVDMLQPVLSLYNPGRTDIHPLLGIAMGGCFCSACEKAAKDQGLDWEWMKADVKHIADMLSYRTLEAGQEWVKTQKSWVSHGKLMMEHPGFYQWLLFRARGVAGLYRVMGEGARAGNPKVDYRFNTCWPEGELYGQDLHAFAEFCDSFRIMEYSETYGDMEVLNRRKPSWIMNVRREIGEDKPLLTAIGIMPMATPELIKRGIQIAADCGVEGLSLAFYDGATFANMAAVKEGMKEAELTL
jgi:hypothetical protein